jgi:hypothetical protein
VTYTVSLEKVMEVKKIAWMMGCYKENIGKST